VVGNDSRDDAAVVDLGDGRGLISTTDFFMPVVDDPFDFGRIAAANALSDVYAMGGTPLVAIAILGWPIDRLAPEIAGRVIAGGRAACADAGIVLAGGHSIDNPEPMFGLAVNGLVDLDRLQRNDSGQAGDLLWLTKPLGLGMLTTAEKRGKLLAADEGCAARVMKQLNKVGPMLAAVPGVHALTDITGFGLGGHLSEVCGARLGASLDFDALPTATDLAHYLAQGTIPGGTGRNAVSYASWVHGLSANQEALMFDPQTSGGLLVAAAPEAADAVVATLEAAGLGAHARPIGQLTDQTGRITLGR
jgi:selenide, water dikinase